MNARKQLLIAAGAAVAVTVLFVVFLIKPKLDQIEQTKQDLTAAQTREGELRLQVTRLEEARNNAPLTAARLIQISQYLPSSPELPAFIRQAQQAATLAGVDLQSIAPSPPAEVEAATGIQRISVTLTIAGGYFRIEDFLSRLEGLDRVVEVTAISLAPTSDEEGATTSGLNSTVTMQMYVVAPNAQLTGTGAPSPSPSPAEETS